MASSLSRNMLLSCEHATNSIPDRFRHLFAGAGDILGSHRGWDPGAIDIACALRDALNAPLYTYPYTRLLIEPNRSERHPGLFSEYTASLSRDEKAGLINSFYKPYRRSVEEQIEKLIAEHFPFVHLSIHTFTPNLNGSIRDLDIGLLYDPSRPEEKQFCKQLKQALLKRNPGLRVKMNRPYKGVSDGFTTALRRTFGVVYRGVELEVNQHYFTGSDHTKASMLETLSTGFLEMRQAASGNSI